MSLWSLRKCPKSKLCSEMPCLIGLVQVGDRLPWHKLLQEGWGQGAEAGRELHLGGFWCQPWDGCTPLVTSKDSPATEGAWVCIWFKKI